MATPVLNPPLTQNHRLLSLPRSHRNNSHGNCHTIRRDHLLRQPPPRAPVTIIRVPAASTNLRHLRLNHRVPAATNLHLHAGECISIAASPSLQHSSHGSRIQPLQRASATPPRFRLLRSRTSPRRKRSHHVGAAAPSRGREKSVKVKP